MLHNHANLKESDYYYYLCVNTRLNYNRSCFLAWVGSLASGSLFLFSMLSVKLCDITSVSFTCVSGSILGGLGLILSSTVKEFKLLYITHSFLFGLGTSLMYTPSLIIIARRFERWRSAATGFVVACGSLGQVVLSPLLQFFMEAYGVLFTFRWWGSIFAVTTILSSLSFYLVDKKDRNMKIAKYNIKWRLLKDKSFVVWMLIMMVTNFTYYIPLIHLVSIFTTLRPRLHHTGFKLHAS